MLRFDRTVYPGGFTQEFHVCPAAATYYNDLVMKYGSDFVFAADNQQGIVNALGRTVAGRNDVILIHPGTYTTTGNGTDATAITISKGVTLEGVGPHPGAVNLVVEADCELFSLTSAADNTVFRNLTITLDTSSTTPQDGIEILSGCANVLIENCIFIGSDKITVAIDSEGDRLTVRNCRFEDVKFAIQSNGAYCKITDNYINSDNTGAIGIELTAGNWCEIHRNILDLSGGTGDEGIKIAAACLLGSCTGNIIHASCSDSINPVSGTTMSFCNNQETGTTATIAYVVT